MTSHFTPDKLSRSSGDDLESIIVLMNAAVVGHIEKMSGEVTPALAEKREEMRGDTIDTTKL